VDYIDESEVLTMADEDNHINKTKFKVPFVCGCRNLGEALVSTALQATAFETVYIAYRLDSMICTTDKAHQLTLLFDW
jgi:SOR/SNZ family